MKRLLAIGEVLIDFVPAADEEGQVSYLPVTGGAPANVCAAFSRLGGPASLISQVGQDFFGDQIIRDLKMLGVDTAAVSRTSEAPTSLAFVTADPEGQGDYLFYRNPGADMLLGPDSICESLFEAAFCLHFCSVSLGDFPFRDAHVKAIEIARKAGLLISFDPNLRFPLWEDKEELRSVIRRFLPLADILKIASDELEFITGTKNIQEALPFLFSQGPRLVLYTKGADGAEIHSPQASVFSEIVPVRTLDTTGAGDAFAGSFLYQLAKRQVKREELEALDVRSLQAMLDFSNRYAAATTTRRGAAASYPTGDCHDRS